jgi:hypothetical protein
VFRMFVSYDWRANLIVDGGEAVGEQARGIIGRPRF